MFVRSSRSVKVTSPQELQKGLNSLQRTKLEGKSASATVVSVDVLGHEVADAALRAVLPVSHNLARAVHRVVPQSGQLLLDVSMFVFLLVHEHFLFVLGSSGQHWLGHVNVVQIHDRRQVAQHAAVVRQQHVAVQQGLLEDLLSQSLHTAVSVHRDRLLDILPFDKDLHRNNLLNLDSKSYILHFYN